jgi:hypothetical protein
MSKNYYLSYDKLIYATKILIDNSLTDNDIKSLLSQYRFDDKRINEGKTLLGETEKINGDQTIEIGLKKKATEDFTTHYKSDKKTVSHTLKIAKITLSDNIEVKNIIESHNKNSKNFPAWVEQTKKLYNHLLTYEDCIEKMSNYGYSKEKLTAEAALITEVTEKKNIQIQEKGLCLQLTEEKKEKIKQLRKWKKDFTTILKIALKDNPQKLEKLGIKV